MNKIYKWNIQWLMDLERAISNWYNIIEWNVLLEKLYHLKDFIFMKKIKEIHWNFDISWNSFESFEWIPKIIKWNFIADKNKFTTLKFFPKEIGWNIRLWWNQLTSIKWIQKTVNGEFCVSWNKLDIDCIKDLPKVIKSSFYIQYNPIESVTWIKELINKKVKSKFIFIFEKKEIKKPDTIIKKETPKSKTKNPNWRLSRLKI